LIALDDGGPVPSLAAWFLLPKDFIEAQAMKMASKSQGSTIRWKRLTTDSTAYPRVKIEE
jgi:hypothetical protein